jgi:ABC-type sugar transport system substrate-binding protein
VAANDPAALVPVFKEAQAAGIHVMSWDGDINFREAFVNLVDYDEFGAGLMKSMASQIGSAGDIAIITTTFTAPNQVRWIEAIKKTAASQYPAINILDVRPAGEDTNKSFQIAQDLIKTTPTLKGIIVLGVPNVPGAAEAVKEAGMTGKIAIVGNSTPGPIKPYIKAGVVRDSLLWNAPDHGYLTVYTAYALLQGKLKVGQAFSAGRLGMFTPKQDELSM